MIGWNEWMMIRWMLEQRPMAKNPSSPETHAENPSVFLILLQRFIAKIIKSKKTQKSQTLKNPKTQKLKQNPVYFKQSTTKSTNLANSSHWIKQTHKPRKTQPNSAHWIKLSLLIFFFFLVSFFRFGYLIFVFDFLGLGICSRFLILGFGSSQRFQCFFRSSLKIADVGFFFVLVDSKHDL